MRQQALRLQLPEHYDYHAWVRHGGVEDACNRLALWLVHGGRLWLTSGQAAGKTHLLSLLREEHPQLGLIRIDGNESGSSIQLVQRWISHLQHRSFWAIDIASNPQPTATLFALFHLLERARDLHRPLLLSWRMAGGQQLPAELESRIRGTLERVEMHPPASDCERRHILRAATTAMQWQIDERILDLLLHLLPRQLETLIPALQDLEQASRARRRQRISQSWVREQLQQWSREHL